MAKRRPQVGPYARAMRRAAELRQSVARFHGLEPLEPRQLFAADLVISEFLAVNTVSIRDEDGQRTAWIEIHNAGDEPSDLSGWRLTNDAGGGAGWMLPAGTSVAPGEFLIVFASGKNRAAPSGELHTDFTLDDADGYLALLDAAGSVMHEYGAYPRQFADVSYGAAFHAATGGGSTIGEGTVDRDDHRYFVSVTPGNPNIGGRANVTDGVFISEFAAINNGELRDEDGDEPDWIELYNATAQPVDLGGWRLTDNAGNLNKWVFPAGTIIEPGEYLIVFASDKNRAIVGSPLHTNFRLTSDGEYLALVDATGTVRHAYAPFGKQFEGVSYGLRFEKRVVQPDDSTPPQPQATIRTPTFDVSMRQSQPNMTFENDGLWVANATRIGEGRWSVAEWDLSGVGEIQTAYLQMAPRTRADAGSVQEAYVIADGIAGLTWNGYQATKPATEQALQSLGRVTVSVFGVPLNTYLNSEQASAADVALLNMLRTTTGKLTVAFKAATGAFEWHDGANLGGPGAGGDMPIRLVLNDPALDPPPPPIGRLYRVDFDDAALLIPFVGNEPLAAAASFRFDDAEGLWANPAVPHHVGGAGGINAFTRTIVDAAGANPITFRHLSGDRLRANNPASPDALHGDIWFFAKSSFVEWELTGLLPNAEYELFHYGGWPRQTFEDHRLTIVMDTNGDGVPETSKTAGLVTGGVHGVHFASIMTDATGRIRGRWQGVAEASSWADTAGFQLALVTGVDPPPTPAQPLNPNDAGYFTVPTPGGPNDGTALLGFVGDTKFSHDRGFYEQGFDLVITVNTPGAMIYYTLDGTIPSPTNPTATLFNPVAPPRIDRTTILRAAAYKDGFGPSNVDTQTYLFLDDVLRQSPNGEAPPGFPASPVNGQVFNYGMDPEIVNSPVWGPQMLAALTQVPSISLVAEPGNLFDPVRGVYVNASRQGRGAEQPVSMELIHPDGSAGFQIDAGLRPRGNFSASGQNPLHSFRIFFRDEYGQDTLRYPLFDDEGADEFRKIDLITAQNDGWAWQNSEEMTFITDVYARDLQRDMGQPYTRSRYYHLYLNGQYWGLFQTQERADANYGETYFGGDADNYDVIKSAGGPTYATEATDGNLDAWRLLWEGARSGVQSNAVYYGLQGLMPDGVTRDPTKPVLLDVDNLIDFMIGVFWTGDEDRPLSLPFGNNRSNNWFAVRDRTGEKGFVFFAHDAEQSFESNHNVFGLFADRVGPFVGSNRNNFTFSNPQWLHQDLMANAEYRLRFADRIHKYMFNDGLLTPQRVIEGFERRAAEIDLAIIAHSARWGDAQREPPHTKDTWSAALESLYANFMPFRGDIVMQQFRNARAETLQGLIPAPLYPLVDAPVFHQHGGEVAAGFQLTLASPPSGGVIWYTLDGSDPRDIGGTINRNARPYMGPIPIARTTRVITRTLVGEDWSALNEALFTVPSSVRISEIHYHPALLASGDSEFIELTNIGPTNIDLTGVRLVLDALTGDGVEYAFMAGDANLILPPGGFMVIARNLAAFAAAYPDVPPSAIAPRPYSGALSNGGETLTLLDPGGAVIHQFAYHDRSPWPALADGGGPSLTFADLAADPAQWADPARWRLSGIDGGTPGRPDPTLAAIPGDIDYNGEVDMADLALLAAHFGRNGLLNPALDVRWKHGDLNGDRRVNISDLALLASYYSESHAAIGSAANMDSDLAVDLLAAAAPTNVNARVVVAPAWPTSAPGPSSGWRHIADLLLQT